MQDKDFAFHYVCTRDEARKLVDKHKLFWVSNCGCREKHGKCSRSRMDVCLYFKSDFPPTGSGYHKAFLKEVKGIFDEAEHKHLVTRPFRYEKDMTQTGGVCFCCDDCCEYFVEPGTKCDKGKRIEKTDQDKCTDCGLCIDACYFTARKMEGDKLIIDREKCYGCGLCLDVCPEECIEMEVRR